MSAPLETCTPEEQRSVMGFLFSKGVKPAEFYSRMLKQYGERCLSRGNVYKWIEQFEFGRTSVTDLYRSGRLVEVSTEVLQNRLNDLIRDDRRIQIAIIAEMCDFSTRTVHSIIYDKLNYSKTCLRWVPRQLTQDHKDNRLCICSELKQRFLTEGNDFLDRIITCDETWVYHFEPGSKRQSLE